MFADQYVTALGVHASHDMLAVARANLAKAGLTNAQVRHGDVYALNVPPRSFDVVAIFIQTFRIYLFKTSSVMTWFQ